MTPENVDASLRSLAAAAERGDECPYIYALSGGWLIAGLPTSAKSFRDATEHDLGRQLAHAKMRDFRGSQEQLQGMVQGRLQPMMAAFGSSDAAPDEGVLNLVKASATTPIGQVLQVPALRIQLAAVGSWWAARPIGNAAPPRAGGSAVWVGAEFSY
jgi:hypothetical protein